ncbi:hypothetical protein SAMN04490357_0040 [Streptomyces misionensis]|uniref:Uncharacterized protein n=1 Tax=Streptomyces misionensis TaxID=67331 RepID=A0A1H4I9B3_9ACTN|nr:hypothetical protein [Streptomyces misionensis]SEB30485.1 hypothetical protein SAMN04490357_0040 [Streptomyces misionensis]
MLIQATLGFAQLHRLELSKASYDLLSAMMEVQRPGGEVNASQAELRARVGLSKNRTSIAMSQLVERHVVLRPEGRYRSYFIHPYFAGYASEEEMEGALREATEAIQAGDLAAPALPAPQRHLAAVPTRRSA